MLLSALAFLAGLLFFYAQKNMPSVYIAIMMVATYCVLGIFFRQKYRIPVACYILPAGYLWAFAAAYPLLVHPLPAAMEGKEISVDGYILSLPDVTPFGSRFIFSPDSSKKNQLPHRIWLIWHHPPNRLNPGDFIHLTVRLKRIHGLMNPGGMDIEAIRFAEGVGAEGYVIESENTRFISHAWSVDLTDQIRQIVRNKIKPLLPTKDVARWLPALVTGERENLPQEDWEVLRRTGTNHLMAIAGLHLGFVSGGVFMMVRLIWRQSARLCIWMPAEMAAGWASLLSGICYGALSGFLLPARRACLMLAAGLLGLLLRRKLSVWRAWSLALFAVLIIQPASVLTDGFWLSFGSVALIIFGVSGRVSPKSLWWKYTRVQWVTTLGLMPLTVWLFRQYSLVSFIANAFAIPWMGFLLLPPVLFGTVASFISPIVARFLFDFAGFSLSGLWRLLDVLSHLSWAALPIMVSGSWCLISVAAGVVYLLLPAGFPGRWMGIIWLMPLFFISFPAPKTGTAWVTLLDVGQGLSAVVQTRTHTLVFDAGPAFGKGHDAGEQTVIPFLQSAGIKKLDRVVVSHGDNDHAGGVKALIRYFPVKELLTSDPARVLGKSAYCLSGQHWDWDGVKFTFLYPASEDIGSNNDSSCVLKISAANGHSILLTGDIEKNAENKLIQRHADLGSSVLVVPHHGSKTSDNWHFITAVHPQWALFPVGYRNRYHFPHQAVVDDYRKAGAAMLMTADAGAVKVVLGDEKVRVSSYRVQAGHLWNQ